MKLNLKLIFSFLLFATSINIHAMKSSHEKLSKMFGKVKTTLYTVVDSHWENALIKKTPFKTLRNHSIKILLVGNCSKSIITKILSLMSQEDILDVVNVNPKLQEQLNLNFYDDHRVTIHSESLSLWLTQCTMYQYMLLILPLEFFHKKELEQIFNACLSKIEPNGTFSYTLQEYPIFAKCYKRNLLSTLNKFNTQIARPQTYEKQYCWSSCTSIFHVPVSNTFVYNKKAKLD